MNYLRFLSFTAAAASIALLASSADAGWGTRGSYGSYGSYGSSGYAAAYTSGGSSGYASYSGGASYGSSGASYGSSGGSYGSSGGSHGTRVGLLGRLAQRIHAHRAARHSRHRSHYSSGGSSGFSSYGSGGSSGFSSYGSGGSSGYSSSYGSYGSYGGGSSGGSYGSSSVPYYSAGTQRSATAGSYIASSAVSTGSETAESSVSSQLAGGNIAADTALLTIAVPESARVIVNGHQTTSTGPIRQFMSKGLKSGYTYTYEVEVQDDVDGRIVSDRQTVTVRAGQAERLAFDLPAADAVETVVTVHVPEDAEVTLAGNSTAATGPIRTFRTRQLKAGETWDDYAVQVAVTQEGRRVVQEKVISLRAGSEENLAFEFDSPADAVVAAR